MARKPRTKATRSTAPSEPAVPPSTRTETPQSRSLAPALIALALELERADDHLALIKVLETLIANAKTRAKCLPSTEARARIKLASVLMEWTDNCARAKTHLEAAQVLLRPLKACEELRVHGLSLLGRCYKMMGGEYRRQRFAATQRGLQAAIGMRERVPEDPTWTMWTFHYYLEHADACAAEEDWSTCESYLNAGLREVQKIHGDKGSKMEVLFTMAQLQRALMQRASGSESSHVFEAAKAADEAMAKMLAENEAPEDTARLRFHYALIRTLGKLMEGDPEAAKNYPSKLKLLINEVKYSNDAAYKWLPDSATFALARYLSAEVLRPRGDLTTAMLHLNAAKDFVDTALFELGVLPQGGEAPVVKTEEGVIEGNNDGDSESERLWVTCDKEMQFRVGQDARPYLHLRVLILESIASIALTSMKYDVAFDVACQLMDMLETYPQTLSLMASHVEMVMAHCLHATGKYKEASSHFARAASLASTPSWRDVATMCSALSILCEDDNDGASRALELVGPIIRKHKDKDKKEGQTSLVNQTLALFTSGCALHRQGQMGDAKNQLGRALKKTFEQEGNQQMIASCLYFISCIALENDQVQQAELDMAESAFSLAKGQEDLPMQVVSLGSMNRIKAIMSESEHGTNVVSSRQQKYLDYEERKKKQLNDYTRELSTNEQFTAFEERITEGVKA